MAGSYDFEGWPSTILRMEVLDPQGTTRKLGFEKIRAPRSSLLGTTHVIDLSEAGYVYAGTTDTAVPMAGPIIAKQALASLGGQAYRKELIARTEVMAHVRTRAAAAYVTAGAKQGLFHRLPDLGTGKQAIYRLPPTTAPGEDATS
jgi:hypothetical protein